MGVSFDRTGSYGSTLIIFAGLSFTAAVLTFFAGTMRVNAAREAPLTANGAGRSLEGPCRH